jgi:cyanate permease
MQSTDLTAALVVPFLYARGSFSYACRWLATVTAAATIVWQLFAKAKPSDLAGAPAAALPTTAAGGGSAVAAAKEKAVEWGIFRVPAVWGMFTYWVANGAVYYTMAQWAPTYFQREFGISAVETGTHLAFANAFHIPGNFASGLLESALAARFQTIHIRVCASPHCTARLVPRACRQLPA